MGKKESTLKPLTNLCRGILVSLLAALVLAGCTPAASSSVPLPPAGGWVEQEVLQTELRYRYEAVSICPQSNGDLWLILSVRDNANEDPKVYHSTDDGQSWQEASGWADPAVAPDGVQPMQYAVTPDGVPWMLGFRRTRENGSGEELLYVWKQGSWQQLWRDERYYMSSRLSAMDDGRVSVRWLQPNGDFTVNFFAADGSSETWPAQGDYLLSDGRRKVEWMMVQDAWYLDGKKMQPLGGRPLLLKDGALYIWRDSGVQVRSLNGMVWEELLPPQESPALQLPGVQVICLAETNESTLLAAAEQPDGSMRLLRYRYDAELSRSGEVLQIYSLFDNYAVRYAVAEYLRAHPGAQVSYRTEFTEEPSREELQTAVQRLAEQLQNGEGPDLLLLDGMLWELPLQQLCADGVFCDLSEAVQGKDLVPAARMGQDGPLFTVSCRVALPVLLLPQEMQPPADLEAFARMVKSGPRVSIDSYDTLFQDTGEIPVWLDNPVCAMLLYMVSRPSLLSGGELDTDAMNALLHTAERLVVLPQPEQVWSGNDWEMWSSWLWYGSGLNCFSDPLFSRTALCSGTRAGIEHLLREYPQRMQLAPAPSLGGETVYFPRQIAAVPAGGSAGAAKELVSVLLSAQVQSQTALGPYETALPVERTALQVCCDDMAALIGEKGRNPENAAVPQALCALLESADTPVYSDTPLDELAAQAVMRVLLGQSAEDSLFQLAYEMARLSASKAE